MVFVKAHQNSDVIFLEIDDIVDVFNVPLSHFLHSQGDRKKTESNRNACSPKLKKFPKLIRTKVDPHP